MILLRTHLTAGRRLLAVAAIALLLIAGRPAYALDVTVDVKVDTAAGPVVHGTTNLPDGTVVAVTVSQSAGSYAATTRATVQSGSFVVGPLTRDGRNLEPGTYKVEVIMEMSVQPKSVRHLLGSHGMQMHGELVRQGSTGQLIDYGTEFNSAAGPGTAGINQPGRKAQPAEPWVLASCTDQVEFLNRSIRAKAVGGHELAGEERDKWIDDCVRQTATTPRQDTVIP